MNNLEPMEQVVSAIMARVYVRLENINFAPDDYIEDGLRMCAKCHTPKQARISYPGAKSANQDSKELSKVFLAPVTCRCRREELERQRDKDRETNFRYWMNTHKQYGISGGLPEDVTFAADNGSNPGASEVGRRYVERWAEMREHNIGILFHGPNSTGKSFHAGMIVNELLKRRVPAIMTSFPSLLAAMEKWGEKQEIVNYLALFDLVVIDDLGVERDSGYSYEQVFHIVDARYRQRKPLIVTTNLSAKRMESAEEVKQKRVFDRVLEMCPIRIALTNENQRAVAEGEKKRLAAAILGGKQ